MTTKIKTFGGNIGIGTTDPGDFKLNVHGSLKTSSLVVNGVTDAQVPIGLIAPWYGSLGSIPSGWALCNGDTYTRTDGGGSIATPDLRTKFIRGANGDAPSPVATGSTGGSNTASLSAANLAPHSHGVTVNQGNANHNHTSTQTDPQHTHGENSNSSTAPHNHADTGQTSVNHVHGENSNSSNANHNHGSAQSDANHGHGLNKGYAVHTHAIRDGAGALPGNPGTTQFFVHEQTYVVSTYSNAPHNHGRSTNTQSPHSHGVTGSSNGPHTHELANANTPHHHNTANNNASHNHSTPQVNAPHSHTVSAVDAPHGHTGSSNATGQATAFSVLNAYYALFYIMKI